MCLPYLHSTPIYTQHQLLQHGIHCKNYNKATVTKDMYLREKYILAVTKLKYQTYMRWIVLKKYYYIICHMTSLILIQWHPINFSLCGILLYIGRIFMTYEGKPHKGSICSIYWITIKAVTVASSMQIYHIIMKTFWQIYQNFITFRHQVTYFKV